MGFFVWLTFSFVLLIFGLPFALMGYAAYKERKEKVDKPEEPVA